MQAKTTRGAASKPLPPYIRRRFIDGLPRLTDRRVLERLPNGQLILRDPKTGDSWLPSGEQLPKG